jgi:DNA-binding response OmpR family regulator
VSRLLLVEDEFLIRLSLCEALGEYGFDVIPAKNGDEALAILQIEHVDLVITDVKMPGRVDGIQLAHRLRHEWPSVAVLVVSGHAQVSDLPSKIPLIRKPYDIDELVRISNALVSDAKAQVAGGKMVAHVPQ